MTTTPTLGLHVFLAEYADRAVIVRQGSSWLFRMIFLRCEDDSLIRGCPDMHFASVRAPYAHSVRTHAEGWGETR